MRCIEGFIKPEPGKTKKMLKSRTELFLGTGYHDYIGELFELRSQVEHMHGLFYKEPQQKDKPYRLDVWQLSIEVEGIARYCLSNFLSNQVIWSHFEDDSKIENFWNLSIDEKKRIWGDPYDINNLRQGLKLAEVKDSDLGLS